VFQLADLEADHALAGEGASRLHDRVDREPVRHLEVGRDDPGPQDVGREVHEDLTAGDRRGQLLLQPRPGGDLPDRRVGDHVLLRPVEVAGAEQDDVRQREVAPVAGRPQARRSGEGHPAEVAGARGARCVQARVCAHPHHRGVRERARDGGEGGDGRRVPGDAEGAEQAALQGPRRHLAQRVQLGPRLVEGGPPAETVRLRGRSLADDRCGSVEATP